jgi:hypothetical protein
MLSLGLEVFSHLANTKYMILIALYLYYALSKAADKEDIIRAVMLVLFTTILNRLLKEWWRIPLHNAPAKWAFPSGHTQTSAVFYLWLAYMLYRKRHYIISCLVVALEVCIMTIIVKYDYHIWNDILGGLCFAVLEIAVYSLTLKAAGRDKIFLEAILFFIAGWLIMLKLENIHAYLWMVQGMIAALLVTLRHKTMNGRNLLYAILFPIIVFSLLHTYHAFVQNSLLILTHFSIAFVCGLFFGQQNRVNSR